VCWPAIREPDLNIDFVDEGMIYWFLYLVCAAGIFFSGTKLSKYGDAIAEKTGVGRGWIGLILMASVTSLPELITGIGSTVVRQLPDIAVGAVFGSCMFNILILALLDAGALPPLSARAHPGHILSASFGILLLAIAAIAASAGNKLPALGWIGTYSILFILIYLLSIRMIFVYERKRLSEFVGQISEELQHGKLSLRQAVVHYAANALIVIVAALFLPEVGEKIALQTGLGQTFVGNIFIALSTSLPEFVVTMAALRIGAVDMAFGNVFGSNLFNMVVLAIEDMLFTKGPILSFVSSAQIVTAIASIAMTSIAIAGLTYRRDKKTLLFSWDSIGIVFFYFFAIALLFHIR
jgi:cation:H+ antiporter